MLALGVHFPKAAGNSLLVALIARYGEALFVDYAEPPALPQAQRHLDPDRYMARRDEPPTGAACIFGHFHPAKYAHLNAMRFTVLRDPVANIVSIYCYFRSTPPLPQGLLHQYVIGENLNVVEMARLPLLRRLMSDAYFGGVDMETFDFIGIHERRVETNAILCDLLELAPFDDVHVNATPPSHEHDEIMASAKTLCELRDLLADDVRFYEQFAGRNLSRPS